MEMYSLVDKLYDGLDVQAGGLLGLLYIILEIVGPLKYQGFHFDSRAFTFLQKIGYPCIGKK